MWNCSVVQRGMIANSSKGTGSRIKDWVPWCGNLLMFKILYSPVPHAYCTLRVWEWD